MAKIKTLETSVLQNYLSGLYVRSCSSLNVQQKQKLYDELLCDYSHIFSQGP